MVKYFLCFSLFFVWSFSMGQTVERTEINGKISVPEVFEPEGIHIYNKTSGYGSASTKSGLFSIKVAEGDSLYFSAVQFEALQVIVSQKIIDSGSLFVEISEGLNELPEILVKPHDLTGNLHEDSKNIKVESVGEIPSWGDLRKIVPEKTSPKNAVVSGIGGGANHLTLLIKGFRMLFPKRDRKKEQPKVEWSAMEQLVLEKSIRTTYDDTFFEMNLGIPPTEVSNFIAYFADKGFDRSLLEKGKEMQFIQFLVEQSQVYLQKRSN